MTLVLFPAPLSFHYRALETGFKTTVKKKKNYYFFTLNQPVIFLIIKRTRNSSKSLANNDTKYLTSNYRNRIRKKMKTKK